MAQYRIAGEIPSATATAFVAREATLVGEAVLGNKASVWFGAVLRGNNEPIRVGARSNIQKAPCSQTGGTGPQEGCFPAAFAHRAHDQLLYDRTHPLSCQ